jgi:hypothetical protein
MLAEMEELAANEGVREGGGVKRAGGFVGWREGGVLVGAEGEGGVRGGGERRRNGPRRLCFPPNC